MKITTLLLAAAVPMALATDSLRHEGDRIDQARRLQDNVLYQMCGVDIIGYDTSTYQAPNPDTCAFLIPGSTDAATWTNYNGGTCWLKANVLLPPTTPNAGASSFLRLPVNLGTYQMGGRQNSDMPGNDIGSTKGAVSSCFTACSNNPKCFAYVWTDYQGGTCWLKSRASAYVPRQGADATYVMRLAGPLNACPRL